MKKVLLSAVASLFLIPAIAQFGYGYKEDVKVLSNTGDTLQLPWAGGFNTPQFSEIDLDQDGKKDLFVFDPASSTKPKPLKTFLNIGESGEVKYVYRPEYEDFFHGLRIEEFVLLRDYNCDGYEDIFTGIAGNIRVYTNDYPLNNFHSFTQLVTILKSQYPNIYTNLYNNNTDIPGIEDIDGDGDIDIISFDSGNNQLTLHDNQSVEDFGACDTLLFDVKTRCWGKFEEDDNNNDIYLNMDCNFLNGWEEPDPSKTSDNGPHEGSTMLPIDLDKDGDKDLLIGDVSFQNLIALTNGGDNDVAVMSGYDLNYPSYDTPVQHLFPAAYYLDVDNDNVKDLITASNSSTSYHNTESAWFYKNIGQTDSLVLQRQTVPFLQKEMIDAGIRATPVFFDYNVDGLLDIVIGSENYHNGSSEVSKLMLLKNIGTLDTPAFQVENTDYASVSLDAYNGTYPTFGDLDNDGDMDMIIGNSDGRINYYENIAAPNSAAIFNGVTIPNYASIDIGDGALPQLFDVDDDQDLDLLIGDRNGNINYFENTGSLSSPSFSSNATNDIFGNIDLEEGPCCSGNSAPFMVYSASGARELYVGSDQGYVWKYGDIDGNLNGTFTTLDSMMVKGKTAICFGSIFGNSNDAFLLGDILGGITIFKFGEVTDVNINTYPSNFLKPQIYPNPFNEYVSFQFEKSGDYDIMVYNYLGELIQLEHINNSSVTNLSTTQWSSGIYLVKVQDSENRIHTQKIIKAAK